MGLRSAMYGRLAAALSWSQIPWYPPMTRQAQGSFPDIQAYLPLDRRRALSRGTPLPEHSWGSLLFADLSGFTPLMEQLSARLGAQQGAEEMTHLLNALFTPLIEQVHGHGGSIVAFAGDALTCWFPGMLEEAAPRAAASALAMQHHVSSFGPAETAGGAATLSMHVGIASGQLRRLCAGRPPHGLYDVLAGAAVDRMAQAQEQAPSGAVVVDAFTAEYLSPQIQHPLAEGFVLLSGIPIRAPLPPTDPSAALPELPLKEVRRWLAEPLYRRLETGRGGFSAELRLVTSLFVQFTGLDYEGDPRVGEKLQRYVTLAQERLAPYEGYLSLVTCGDKGSLLHILFGAPIAHEDDPARAVGFALEFREAAEQLAVITGQRFGISLGRVYAGILGSARRCTYTVLGDEVNVSARLMQVAEVGHILTSQRVQQATEERFFFRSLGTVQLRGKEEPTAVFEPEYALEQRAEEPEEHLFGREQEKRFLAKLLSSVEAGSGQVLQIAGEAGVGKSALVRELFRQVQARSWIAHVGVCLSYGRSTPYLPWRVILEQVCELDPESTPAQRAARLEQAVAELPDPPERPDYWRARFPLLAEAMGLEVPDTPLTRSLEGELRRSNTFHLLEALVRHLARERPAVVVLEDAYWADELSLSLALHIARGLADIPLLLVLAFRPFSEPIPAALQALEALPLQRMLALAPLEQDSAMELAQQQLRGATLPPHLETLLQERAQGNPFFIEELLRALQEAGFLRRTGGMIELSGVWEELELPETIEGVVRARIDCLPEAERVTLKVASVIGRTFQRPLLQEVHPSRPTAATLGRQLSHLQRADFTLLEQPAPEWRYAFRQPILHEVTYETLLFAQRRQLHGAIGVILEAWHAGDLPRVLDLLAYHYARSEERAKAVHYLQQAGEKARREYANEVALGYYGQALERLLPEETGQRYDLLAGRERIYDLLGQREAQEQDLLEMGRLADELRDPRRQVEVLNRRARRAADMGAFEEGQAIDQIALATALQIGDQLGEAEAHKTLGFLQVNLGEYENAQQAFERALQIYRILENRDGESITLNNLGLLSYFRGDMEAALEFYRQSLEMIRELGNRRWEGLVLDNMGMIYLSQGYYDQARLSSEQARAIFDEIGDLPSTEIALSNIATEAMVQGDLETAQSYYHQAIELAQRLGDREGEATNLSNLGTLHIYHHQAESARRYLRTALSQFRQIGHRPGEAATLHRLGVMELRADRARAAQGVFRMALALYRQIGEAGNALVTQVWLGLACLALGESEQARSYLEDGLSQLQTEGYRGDSPEQEIWWAAFQIWQACGKRAQAGQALTRAHELVQEQAGRIGDATLRQSFLERVPINWEIIQAWGELEAQG